MPKRVLKYEVLAGHPLEIILPTQPMEDDCIHVDIDQTMLPNSVFMWLEINDTYLVTSKRRFEIFPTGVTIPDDAEHCGSVRHISTGLVWHLYEMAVAQ